VSNDRVPVPEQRVCGPESCSVFTRDEKKLLISGGLSGGSELAGGSSRRGLQAW